MRRFVARDSSNINVRFIAFSPTYSDCESEAFGLGVRSERTGSPSGRTDMLSSYPESVSTARAVAAFWTCAWGITCG